MDEYDPLVQPDPKEWSALDDAEKHDLAEAFHEDAEPPQSNVHMHATIHVVVENQIAMGDTHPAGATLRRLVAQGLDRHEAVHAIGSVLAGHMFNLLSEKGGKPTTDEYRQELRELTAEQWRREYADDEPAEDSEDLAGLAEDPAAEWEEDSEDEVAEGVMGGQILARPPLKFIPPARSAPPPRPTSEPIEYRHPDVLQNIEQAITTVYRESPELTDYAVSRMLEALADAYAAEKVGRPPRRFLLSKVEQDMLADVRHVCDWRLGRAPLGAASDGAEGIAPTPIDLPTLQQCLKRLRKSVEHWTREGGPRGYLDYVSQFMP